MPWHPDEIQGATHLQTSWTTATGHLQRPDPVGCISSSCSKNEVGRGRKMNDCEGESRKEKKKRWNGKGRLMVWLRFRRRSVGWICWREEERVSKKLITFQTFWLGHGIINVALVGSIYPFLNLPPLRQLIQEMNYISQTKKLHALRKEDIFYRKDNIIQIFKIYRNLSPHCKKK